MLPIFLSAGALLMLYPQGLATPHSSRDPQGMQGALGASELPIHPLLVGLKPAGMKEGMGRPAYHEGDISFLGLL